MATPKNKKKKSTKKIAASLALLLTAASALTVTSLAVFTDTETVTANTFSSGSLDLTVGTTSALLTASAMVPGDAVTAPLVVGNGGSLDLRYAMSSVTTGGAALAAQLVLTVKSGVTTCDNANYATDGTDLYTGPLNAGAIGSNAQGADTGDRNLNVAANETLCFNVTLPTTATNTAQGLSATTVFTFDAEQTINNP